MSKSNLAKEIIQFSKCRLILHFRKDDDSALESKESIEDGYEKSKEFFDHDLKKDIDIRLVYSRKEMDGVLKRETPN